MNGLHVRTFGEFSITYEDRRVSDSDNRSRKVWPLLAYLICHRNRLLKQHELIDLLWGESEQGVNPAGALKTLFYRVRSELDKLWPGAGKQLIVCQGIRIIRLYWTVKSLTGLPGKWLETARKSLMCW